MDGFLLNDCLFIYSFLDFHLNLFQITDSVDFVILLFCFMKKLIEKLKVNQNSTSPMGNSDKSK